MTDLVALRIVMELAENNVLEEEYADQVHILKRTRERQLEAIEHIRKGLLKFLTKQEITR